MSVEAYRYTFPSKALLEEVEATLVLPVRRRECPRRVQVRLDAAHHFDLEQRLCVIDASTAVGCTLNRLFVGFLCREYGAASSGSSVSRRPTPAGPLVGNRCGRMRPIPLHANGQARGP